MRIYKDTLLQKKTTKSMVVYGNQQLRALYIPKELLRAVYGRKDNYPKEVVLSLRTTDSDTVSSIDRDQKRFAPGSQVPRKEANSKDLGKDIRKRDSR